MNYGFEDKTLIELLEVIRFSAVERTKRCRLPKEKLREVDDEFKRLVKTIRLGRHIARTGYRYLHATSKIVDGKLRMGIQVRLSSHGTKAVVTTDNWKDFVKWVDGYWIDKPNNLEQWQQKYGHPSQRI